MLEPNTLLQNRYLIERKLGQGGMGAVYRAIDKRFDTVVALKQTLVRDESLRKAFEREARLLNKLRHAALPHVIDFFAEGENEFLVMQFIPGDDFTSVLEKHGGPLPVDQVVSWADQILAALEYLHSHEPPIVHRDIKPQNIKRTPEGEIVLLDFGLSKGSAADLSQATGGASIAGYTPHFAPLEQIRGAGTNPRSDLYSLAATLYMMLSGRMPPDALERASAMLGGRPDPLTPISEIAPHVPPPIASVLHRALSQAPEGRWPSASEMRKAMREAARSEAARTVTLRPGATIPERSPSPATRPPSGPSGRPTAPASGPPSGPGGYAAPPGPSYPPRSDPRGWQPPANAPVSYPPRGNAPMSGPVSYPPQRSMAPSAPPPSYAAGMPVSSPVKTRGFRATLLGLWLTLGLIGSFVVSILVEAFIAVAMGNDEPSGKLTLLLTMIIYVTGALVFGFLMRR